jgi:hypothetical protein
MSRPDTLSIPFSAGSVDAIAAHDASLDRFLAASGDPLEALAPALAAEPEFAAGHLLVAGLAVAAWDKRSFGGLRRSLAAALPLAVKANPRERAHFDAARAWLAGEHGRAAEQYAAIVRRWPGDLLALRLTQAAYVFTGRSGAHLRVVAPALAAWRPGMPGYEHVLAMHAFALAESGEGARAEESARRALEVRPRHPFAIHAVAHAALDRGRAADGASWLAGRAADWAGDGGLARHLAWHEALFQLELGRIDRALARFDGPAGGGSATPASDAGDAAAFLWRLELEGVDAGNRWRPVADAWAARSGDAFWPLLDVHAMMAFAADRRDAEAAELLRVMESAAQGCTNGAGIVREVALPAARAVLAFGRGQYARCADLAAPLRNELWRLGGSRAQRDTLDLMALEAAIRAGRSRLAQAIVAARKAAAPLTPRARVQAARAGAIADPRIAA